MHRLNAFFVAALVALGSLPATPAQTFETVYSVPDSGGWPAGALVKTPAGAFLGTASSGGAAGFGTIFRVTPQGEVERLASFNGDNGLSPGSTLTLGSDGKYYGITIGGGERDFGVAFRVSVTGELEKLANFSSIKTPAPTGRLVQGTDGSFYGLCWNPGTAGLVFKLSPANVLSVVARFPDNGVVGYVGNSPFEGFIEQEDGTFLGATKLGGSDDKGVIFKVSSAGVITKLVDFTGTNGSGPVGGIVRGSDGNYYGATELGGGLPNSTGTIFKITPAGVFSTVAGFEFANGQGPQGSLVEINGTFYGMTRFGGANQEGTVFKITPGDAVPTIIKLADLGAETGLRPLAGLTLGDDGNLYGTTSLGGATKSGTIIKVTPEEIVTKIADLGAPSGQNLAGGVVSGPSGLLYGASTFGGSSGGGTLFQLTTGGAFTELADFEDEITGAGPASRIIAGSDHNLYGVTSSKGRLFTATPAGMFSATVPFPGEVIFSSGIIEGSDGAFYGAWKEGYSSDPGRIFRYTIGSGLETLYEFRGDTGNGPAGPLVEGPDGALYGTTLLGGAFNKGTVFRITKSGNFKTLASFSGNNGAQPAGPLVLARDGNFYGVTRQEGPNSTGTIFRVSPTGKLSKVAAFNGFNGAYPVGGLVAGPGGNLYGVAYAGGGPGKFGTVFKVSLSGKITVLQTFDGNTNGAYPTSTLSIGPDGNIYGTTFSTVFRLLTLNHSPVANNDSFELPVIQKKVIDNDTDPDKDPLAIVSVTDGAHGTVDFTDDGTVTYTPGPDFDSETVQTDTFTYTVSDRLGGTSTASVTVSVPSSLFRAGAGAYGGVLALNGSAQGYWAIAMTGVGAFTGAIQVDGAKTPIKGIFGSDGSFSQTILRKEPLSPLIVNLQLNVISNTISGTVSNGVDTYSVELIRNLPIYSSARPNPHAGRYTVLLSPTQAGDLLPGGTGFAKMTVSPKGAVAIAGKLGDGAPFAAGSFITNEGEVPFYAQAYLKKKGYAAGLLSFEDLPASDVRGSLTWKKPEQVSDARYPAGFTTIAILSGARYAKASPVLPVIPSVTPNASLNQGGSPFAQLGIAANNVVRVIDELLATTKVKIDATTGVFTGSISGGGTRYTFGGVVYQKGEQRGEGIYVTETATTTVSILPTATP